MNGKSLAKPRNRRRPFPMQLHQYAKSTHLAKLPLLLKQHSDFDALQDLQSLKKFQYSLFDDWKHHFYPFGRDGAVKIF